MNKKGRKFFLTSKSFIYAVAIHVVIGALLFVSLGLDKSSSFAPRPNHAQPVQATALTEADIDKEMKLLKKKDLEKLAESEEAQKKLEDLLKQTKRAEEKRKKEEQKLEQEKQKLAKIKEQKKKEATKAKEAAKKRKEQEQKLAKLEKEKLVKLEKEKKKKAEEKKKKEQADKKKREAEKKKKAIAAKKKKEAEKKKQAEIARKKKLADEKRRKEAELRARMEEERIAGLFNRALNQYKPIIRQKVSRNWNQPPNTQRGISARVNVRLTQTGDVISARVTQSSGNPVFDRSVENAVYKASPLPIPRERGVNEKFRNLNLTFKPEDLIS